MTRQCGVEACEKPLCAKGMCEMHYARVRRGVPLDAPVLRSRSPKAKVECADEGCDRSSVAKGLCAVHRNRELRGAQVQGPIRVGRRIADDQPMARRTQFRRRAAAGLTQPVFRYPWNQRFFDEWSDDMAWLVGLIWSDGCLMGNRINVCSKDRQLIELVETLIEQPNGTRPKNNGRHFTIDFCSPHAAGKLRQMGLTEAKSWTVPWPTGMPDEFSGSFVRGLLDGDGTVCFHGRRPGQRVLDLEVALSTASDALAVGFSSWLAERDIAHRVTPRRNSVIQIVLLRREALRRLHSLIYPCEELPCLLRKRELYDQWMTTPRPPVGRRSRVLWP